MAFKAWDQSGAAHHAFRVKRSQGPFFCQVCQGAMLFVDPKVRMRPHFRHSVESNCAWEPETLDHENAKLAVCEAINRLGKGTADIEVPVGTLIADVLWTDGQHHVAFEIQRANYSWAKFTEKFLAYHQKGVAVVYLLIGPDFYQGKMKGDIRLKDIEQRLFLGRAEERGNSYRAGQQEASLMQLQRIYPEQIGRVVGGYLRRQGVGSDRLLVREPIFYRTMTKAGFQSANHAVETGAALSTLPDYLQAVHDRFLANPGTVFWNGLWFSRLEEAVWASFFSALGLTYTYAPDQPGRPAAFRFKGGFTLVAWLAKQKRPVISGNNNELRLDEEPHLKNDYLFVGAVGNDLVDDDGILACYSRDLPKAEVDFSQYNQSFHGVITGHHDGGSPGGLLGSEIAKDAYELWLDCRAKLTRGVSIPLGRPTFTGLNGYPTFPLLRNVPQR